MRLRYQRGCLRCIQRKSGPDCWEFLWRENDGAGKRVRRTAVIGTVEEYPTKDLAQAAVNGLRICINEDRNRQREQRIPVADLVDHYIQTELAEEADWRSHSTRIVYREFLKRWIRPRWADLDIRDVRTVVVERWLRQMHRADGAPLADATRAKIRNLMSVLFNHAIRYEWLEQGKNPITLVRQGAKRKNIPTVLEPPEIQSLLLQLSSSFRLMVLLDATTGLRRSELFALKWSDVDFSNLELNVTRSIYLRVIGNCKTEAPRKPVPIDAQVAADLWLWKETSTYSKSDDWIFASPPHGREISFLARYRLAEDCSSSSTPSGNHQQSRVAHISPLLLLAPSGQWLECEGGAGTDAARQQSNNTRNLFTGAEYSEAASSGTSCPDDPSRAVGGCGTSDFLWLFAARYQLGRRNRIIWEH